MKRAIFSGAAMTALSMGMAAGLGGAAHAP
jgi:hypothetical protein